MELETNVTERYYLGFLFGSLYLRSTGMDMVSVTIYLSLDIVQKLQHSRDSPRHDAWGFPGNRRVQLPATG